MTIEHEEKWACIRTLLLKSLIGYVPMSIIIKLIGLDKNEVEYRMRKLGLKSISVWRPEIKQFIIANYDKMDNDELAEYLNKYHPRYDRLWRSSGDVDMMVYKFGCKRSKKLVSKFKSKKLQKQWDNGDRQFNWNGAAIRKIGDIVLNNTTERGIIAWIKIRNEKNGWQKFKDFVYNQHFGEIPKGYRVAFLNDKNHTNFTIEDLSLVNKNVSARESSNNLTDKYVASQLLVGMGRNKTKKEAIETLIRECPSAVAAKKLYIQNRRYAKQNKKLAGNNPPDER